MKCEEARDRLATAAAAGTSPDETVRAHLAGCPECPEEAAEIRRAAAVLHAAHVLEAGRELRAPLFGARRALTLRWAGAGAVAALVLLAVFLSVRPDPTPPPAPPGEAAFSGPGTVERVGPQRLRLYEGAAEVVAPGPFVVETLLATLAGPGPARFRVELEEVREMSPNVKRGVAGAVVIVAIALVVTVDSGWLTLTPEDGSPPERVDAGQEKRIERAEPREAVPLPPGETPDPDPAPPAPAEARGAVYGRLVHDDGTPVAGEPVWVSSGPALVVRTDDEGNYRIENLVVPEFPQNLMLGPPFAATVAGAVRLRVGEAVRADFTIPRGRDLTVVVTFEGTPAPGGIQILLGPEKPGGGGRGARGKTGPDGTLHLRRLPPDLYTVRVDHQGWRRDQSLVDLRVPGFVGTHRVDLVPAPRLRVRIENWTEGRSADLYLQLRAVDNENIRDAFVLSGKTAPDGTFEGDAPPPGRYRGALKVAGWFTMVDNVVVPEQGPVDIVVTMPVGARVSGWVYGPDGKPLTRGEVRLNPCFTSTSRPTARIGKDGSFLLLQVPPGKYMLGLSLKEPRPGGTMPVALNLQGQTFASLVEELDVGPAGVLGLKVSLPRGGTVEGRMTGERPRLIQNATIERWTAGRWEAWGDVSARQDGTFVARHLPPGRWRIVGVSMILAEDRGADPVEIEIAGEDDVKKVEIRWYRVAGVEVRLRTPSGAPFTEHVTGFLTPVGESGAQSRFVQLRPDEKGLYTVKFLTPGRWNLSLVGGPEKLFNLEFEVREGVPVELTLWD